MVDHNHHTRERRQAERHRVRHNVQIVKKYAQKQRNSHPIHSLRHLECLLHFLELLYLSVVYRWLSWHTWLHWGWITRDACDWNRLLCHDYWLGHMRDWVSAIACQLLLAKLQFLSSSLVSISHSCLVYF